MKKLIHKKEKGITLIALILTIVILIIIAAVTVKIITDNNFIGMAANAANKYGEEQAREGAMIDSVGKKMQEIAEKNGNEGEGGNLGGINLGETNATADVILEEYTAYRGDRNLNNRNNASKRNTKLEPNRK